MAKAGKRIRGARDGIDVEQAYSLEEAIGLIKARASAKFDETIEIAINLGVDPRHADQMVRGTVQLPNGTGRSVRVAVFAKDDKADEAREAGADRVGAEDLAEEIQKGVIDFDRCIATPDMMSVVGRLGRILGPRGMMPNPKLGTVTPNVAQAVSDQKSGKVEYRVDKSGIIHCAIGRRSFSLEKLVENASALIDVVRKARPASTKGIYMKKIAVSTTMGPGIKIDPSAQLTVNAA